MHRHAIKAELHSVHECRAGGVLQATPLDEMDLDSTGFSKALLHRLLTVASVLELQNEGLRVVKRDGQLAGTEAELVGDDALNVLGRDRWRGAHRPGDGGGALPFAQLSIDGMGGWDEEDVTATAGKRGTSVGWWRAEFGDRGVPGGRAGTSASSAGGSD